MALNSTKLKSYGLSICLISFGLVIGLLLAEIVVRSFFPSYSQVIKLHQVAESERGKFSRYDEQLGWVGLENANDNFEWVDTSHHVQHNSHGFRSKQVNVEKSDRKRVLFLGDSFVWGFGVENNEIFTSLLEQKNSSMEFINMGVSGYGNDQAYLLWIQQGKKFSPDHVVLMLTLFTDFWDNVEAVRYGYPKPLFVLGSDSTLTLSNVPVPKRGEVWKEANKTVTGDYNSWLDDASSYSATINLVRSVILQNDKIRNVFESNSLVLSRRAGFSWEYPLYLVEQGRTNGKHWVTMFKILERLRDDVEKHGAKFSVVIIPSIVQVYPELWSQFVANLEDKEQALDLNMPNSVIKGWSEMNNVEVLDLLPSLKKAGLKNPYLYYPINRHWTFDGHKVVADTISSYNNW